MALLQFTFETNEIKSAFGVPPKPANDGMRGVDGHTIALVLAHADIEVPLVGGHVGLRVSRQLAKRNDMRAVFGRSSETISDIMIVWSEYSSSVVTVLLHNNSRQTAVN